MKQVLELLKTGLYEPIIIDRTRTIKKIIKELNIEEELFGIFINGKKAGRNDIVYKNDKVVIIPCIAGGAEIEKTLANIVPDFLFLKDLALLRLDFNAMLKQKECFKCKKPLSFRDYIVTNKRRIKIELLIKTWQSEEVQIFCCSCFQKAEEQRYILENEGVERKCSTCETLIKKSDFLIKYRERRDIIERLWFSSKLYCDKCESELKKKKNQEKQETTRKRIKLMREKWRSGKVTVVELKEELGLSRYCVGVLVNGVRVNNEYSIDPDEDVRFVLLPSAIDSRYHRYRRGYDLDFLFTSDNR